MELAGGDLAVLVDVVEVEGVAELLAVVAAVVGRAVLVRSTVEISELLEINVAVAVGVDLRHNALDLVVGGVGAEGPENVLELGAGDLSIAVLVELVEYLLHLLHGSQRAWRLLRNRFLSHLWVKKIWWFLDLLCDLSDSKSS